MWGYMLLSDCIRGQIKFFLFPNTSATHYCMANLCWWVFSHSEIHQPLNGSIWAQIGPVIWLQSFASGLSWFNIHWISIINLVLVSEAISIMRIGLFMKWFRKCQGYSNAWYLWYHDPQGERWEMSNKDVISEDLGGGFLRTFLQGLLNLQQLKQ